MPRVSSRLAAWPENLSGDCCSLPSKISAKDSVGLVAVGLLRGVVRCTGWMGNPRGTLNCWVILHSLPDGNYFSEVVELAVDDDLWPSVAELHSSHFAEEAFPFLREQLYFFADHLHCLS